MGSLDRLRMDSPASPGSTCTWPGRGSHYQICIQHEPEPYVPPNPISEADIIKVLELEAEDSKDWRVIKSTKDITVKRKMLSDTGRPIVKSNMTLTGIPYKKAINLITDIKLRREWDQQYRKLDVLEKIGNFQVIYCQLKMPTFYKPRELVEAVMERVDDSEDNKCHIVVYRTTSHPSIPTPKKCIRAESPLSGIIIRPVDDGSESSRITVLSQYRLHGSAPRMSKNRFISSQPVEWYHSLLDYIQQQKKREQKQRELDEKLKAKEEKAKEESQQS